MALGLTVPAVQQKQHRSLGLHSLACAAWTACRWSFAAPRLAVALCNVNRTEATVLHYVCSTSRFPVLAAPGCAVTAANSGRVPGVAGCSIANITCITQSPRLSSSRTHVGKSLQANSTCSPGRWAFADLNTALAAPSASRSCCVPKGLFPAFPPVDDKGRHPRASSPCRSAAAARWQTLLRPQPHLRAESVGKGLQASSLCVGHQLAGKGVCVAQAAERVLQTPAAGGADVRAGGVGRHAALLCKARRRETCLQGKHCDMV